MADIVLKDGSDVSTTYRETKALGVDTPDGGIALFFSEEVIPKEYTHPDTHHASMITGLSNVARSGNYNDLVGKLVGDLPRLEEVTLKFAEILECMCRDIPGVWDNVLGHSFTIVWDGHPYEGVFKNVEDEDVGYSNGYYLGNLTKALNLGRGEDTGEPFVITVDIGDPTYCTIMTDDPKETHTISITPNSVKKLDKKYLPDEAATKDFVADEIAKIQASGGTSEIDILPEFTSDDENKVLTIKDGSPAWATISGASAVTEVDVLAKATLEFKLSGNSYNTSLPALFELIVDESYVVLWDDTEYNCVAYETEIGNRDAVCLGNKEVMTSGSTEILEPFVISHIPDVSVISLAVANGDESPSHAVRIYQKVESAPQYSWNDIADKPFGGEIQSIELMNDTISFDYMDKITEALYGYGSGYIFNNDVSKAIDAGFNRATVEWNGTEYAVETIIEDGVILLGNFEILDGIGDNGLPFAMAIVKVDGKYGAEIYAIESIPPENIDNPEPITKTVKVSIEINNIKTLDLRYLPEHLQLGKESTNVVEILPLQTYENFSYSSTYKAYCTSTGNPPTLTLGETYIVSWDGEEYKCVAQDASAMIPGAIFVGNSTALGVPSDEPFAIGVIPGMGVTFISATDTEAGNSHTVGIKQEVIVAKTLDLQYLPEALRFGEAPITATLIDGSYDVVTTDESGDVLMSKDLIPVISDIHLTEGNTYTVVWDGVEYECRSFNLEGLQCVGNSAAAGIGEDTGEPFLIGEDIYGAMSDGLPGFMFYALNTSDPSVTEMAFDVKLIYNGNVVQKLDGKYLPDLFEYLPEQLQFCKIPAGTVLLEETTANCNIDLTGYYVSAYGRPFGIIEGVNYNVQFDGNNYVLTCECKKINSKDELRLIGDSFEIIDNFNGSDVCIFSVTTPGEHTFEIRYAEDCIKKIDKEYLPDDIGGGGSSLPKVTTSDNNKVMTVVNGAWAAQTPASELPTVTGSDNNKVLKVINGSWGIGNETNELPTVTSSDAGKFLRVSSTGTWIVEALQDVSEVGA